MSHTHLIGKPWVANAQGPEAFDCWGLVRYWFKTQLCVKIPMSPVSADDLKAVINGFTALSSEDNTWQEVALGESGEVIAMGKNARITHAGVHIGGGFVLHCSRDSGMVAVQTISQLQRQWGTLKIYQYKG